MNWNDARTVLAVARYGSLRVAGRALCLSRRTIGRCLFLREPVHGVDPRFFSLTPPPSDGSSDYKSRGFRDQFAADSLRVSIARCHARNSSTDNSYRRQTSSRLITPVRTALTITALRRDTQRCVSGGGNSIALDAISPPSDRGWRRCCSARFRVRRRCMPST